MENESLIVGNSNWAVKANSLLGYAVGEASGKYVPREFTFTRNSTATYTDENGIIQTAAANIARVQNNALLLEPQRTNLALYSEQFDNAAWTKLNTTVESGFTSPDGTDNAFKLTEDTSTGTHKVTATSAASNIYTISVYAKYNGRILQIASTSTVGHYANFDLLNGVIGNFGVTTGNVTITEFANGWYRCSMTTTSNMNTAIINTVQSVTSVYQESYTGDGTSGVFIWGAQLEVGSYATTYIPTTSSSATRVADVCSKTGISSLIGQTEGTLFYDFVWNGIPASIGDSALFSIGIQEYGTSNIAISSYNGALYGRVTNGISVDATITFGAMTAGTRYKAAFAYANNDVVFYVNGVNYGIDTSVSIPAVSNVNLQNAFTNSKGVNQAVLFPTRLTNAELASITTI